MKYLFTLILALFVFFPSYAQDPQLFENDWYLQKVVIDELDYFPPNIVSEPETGSINFYEDIPYADINYCGILWPAIEYDTNTNIFTLEDNPVILLGDCINAENNTFGMIYFSVFYDQIFAKNPFAYNINNDNEIAILTIVNPNGGLAVYGSELLSNQDFSTTDFNIYPNPARDKINIENRSQQSINKIQIYDILGRLVLEQNNPSNQIDVSKLDSGLLLLKIEIGQGMVIKKLIKN